jgi:hypothetical protein
VFRFPQGLNGVVAVHDFNTARNIEFRAGLQSLASPGPTGNRAPSPQHNNAVYCASSGSRQWRNSLRLSSGARWRDSWAIPTSYDLIARPKRGRYRHDLDKRRQLDWRILGA